MSDVSAISSPGAVPIATGAIKQSLTNLDKDASVIANSTAVDSTDTLSAQVDSRQQVLYTRAAAKVVSVDDAMISNLLDIRA